MSFLADPPLLVVSGAAIERLARRPDEAESADRAVLALFLGVSGLLYVNAPGLRWFWRGLGAASGRDWMINSGVTRFEHRRPAGWVHVLAIALFALYPRWLRLGHRLGARLP